MSVRANAQGLVSAAAAPPREAEAVAAPRPAQAESAHVRVVAALLASLLVGIPFVFVRFPPVTDLPQHVAQIRLFLTALADPEGAYRIQWFTPYSAAYIVLGAAWALCTPDNAGRVAMVALAVLWTWALHALAARRQRPVAGALLATVLFFNHTVYWGFLSFIAGWLAFVVWMLVTTRGRAKPFTWQNGLTQLMAALLLYCSHALWFAFGLVWLAGYALVHRWSARATVLRVASVAPVALAALWWYPQLAAQGFVSPTVWFTAPPARLSPEWLVDAMLGGFYGPAEYLIAALLCAWVTAGLWQRRTGRGEIDGDLLWTGLLLLGLGLLLPDEYMNTIQFAARWVPAGAVLVLLAVPAPTMHAPLQRALAVAILAVFSLATTLTWLRFERDELSGLHAALGALPDGQRVIGLDLVQDSAIVKGRPFLQTFAYAQVIHGGRLNASFAGFAPSLVVYRQPRPAPWTPNLEWFAERVRSDDLVSFDYALVNGRPDVHDQASRLPLEPVTADGRWRLYRVVAPTR